MRVPGGAFRVRLLSFLGGRLELDAVSGDDSGAIASTSREGPLSRRLLFSVPRPAWGVTLSRRQDDAVGKD